MKSPRGGYTIIEVMIVLAVSSVMFVAATTLLAGKQGKTEFSQALRDIESQIQSVVNDVEVSRFPEASQYTCKIDPISQRPVLSDTAGGTGTNVECIFLGKAIQVVNDDDANTNDSLNIYTVLGRRSKADGTVITNFADTNPKPIMGSHSDDAIDLTETYTLPFGTNVRSATIEPAAVPTPTDLVGFYNGLQASGVEQGSQSLLTLGYVGFNTDPDDSYAQVRSTIEGNPPFLAQSVKAWIICISSGTSTETARITVNASYSGITTKLDFINCT